MKKNKVITKKMVNGRFCVDSIKRTYNNKNHKEFEVVIDGKVNYVVVEGDMYGTTYYNFTRGLQHETTNPIDENYNTLTNSFHIIDAEEDLMEKGYGERFIDTREVIVIKWINVITSALKDFAKRLNNQPDSYYREEWYQEVQKYNEALLELLTKRVNADFSFVADKIGCHDEESLYNFVEFYLYEEEGDVDYDIVDNIVSLAYPNNNEGIA